MSDQSGMSMSSRPVRVRVRSLFSLRSLISAALTVIRYSQVVIFDSPLNLSYALYADSRASWATSSASSGLPIILSATL